MKKILLMTAICCLLLMAGCGSKKTNDIRSLGAAADMVADKTTTDGETVESFVIPSYETFAEMPADAVPSFDQAVKTVDKTFPKKKKSTKRYYGYLGEEQIEGELSYVFAVYDSNGDKQSTVATAAVTADCSKVYALDETSGQYWLIERYEPEKPLAEFSWTVTASPEETLPTADEDI